MDKRLGIYTIPNNSPGKSPRQPMVQLIGAGYDTGSITFHPRHAAHVIRAIKAAAKSAAAGRKRRAVEIDTTD